MSLRAYGSSIQASFIVQDSTTTINVDLTEDEAREIQHLGLRIFERKQQAIARSIADMKPELLPAPDVQDAEYEDVSF